MFLEHGLDGFLTLQEQAGLKGMWLRDFFDAFEKAGLGDEAKCLFASVRANGR